MSYDKSVADHYLHGNLLDAIKIALLVMGKTIETATIEDLAAVDEFHVGMNIDDKVSLFTEIFRVGIYDIMRQQDGELTYPVPWATDSSTSKLSTLLDYIQALQQASFDITQENNRRDFSLGFFNKLRVKAEAKGSLAPLGLHILIQENAVKKLGNMIENIEKDLIAPVEIIARKL